MTDRRLPWRRGVALLAGFASLLATNATALAERPVAGAIGPDRLKLPSGPNSVRGLAGEPTIDPFYAQVNYQVPIELPAGLGGLAPSLALTYVGTLGNGPLGIGWSLSHTRIQRATRLGVPKYLADDELEISGVGSGRLVPISATEYRVEGMGQTVRVTRVGDGFEVDDGSGLHYRLGETPAGRQDSGSRTFAWLCEDVTNQMGERVRYEYQRDQGQLYLTGITWGPRDIYRVDLAYSARPDVVKSYREGFSVVTARRLDTITVTAEAMVRRAYQMVYTPPAGVSGFSLTRLYGVTSTGKAGRGSWPALSFTYAPVAPATSPEAIPGVGTWRLNGNGISLVDLDGDGASDLLQLATSGHGWRQNRDGVFQAPASIAGSSQSITDLQLQDIDGDARPELLGQNASGWLVWKFVRNQWIQQSGPWPGSQGIPLKDPATARFADLNGDGLVDAIRWNSGGLLVSWASRTGLGAVQPLARIGGSELPSTSDRFYDVNGDGLDDYVVVRTDHLNVFLGHGDGTFDPLRAIAYPTAEPWVPDSVELGDLDRDGLMDLVRIDSGTVRWFRGLAGGGFSTPPVQIDSPEPLSPATVVTIADSNGNGSQDLVWSTASNLWRLDLAGTTTAGMLVGVQNGLGMDVSFQYRSSHSLSAAARTAGLAWASEVPISMPVPVHKTTALGPGEVTRHVDYKVADGMWDAVEQRFGGFLLTTVTTSGATPAETGSVITRHLAGLGTSRMLRGKPSSEQVVDGTGRRLSLTNYDWTTMVVADLPDVPLLRAAIMTHKHVRYEDTNPVRETDVTYGYDTLGRATHEVDSGRIDIPGDESVKDTTYADDATTWIRNRVCKETVASLTGAVASDVQHLFGDDQTVQALCVVGKGWPRETRAWLADDNRWVTQEQIRYDIHGNPTAVVQRGVERRLQYDPDGLFVTEEQLTAPGGELVWSATWDRVLGVIETVADPNGHTVSMRHDDLGRLTTTALDGRAPHQEIAYDWTAPFPKTTVWAFDGALSDVTARPTTWAATGRWRQTVEVSNGLGEVRYRAVRLANDRWIVSNYHEVDPNGRVVFAGRPVIAGQLELRARPTDVVTNQVIVGDQLRYDPLGRLIEQTLPTGARRTYSYFAFERTMQDADLAPVHSVIDGQGRAILTERSLPDGTHEIVRATYDPMGRLTQMTLSGGTVTRSFQYDTLGRLTQSFDPDLGTRILTWDDGDRLRSETNAVGQTVRYSYDLLGRLATRDTGSVFTYHYDAERPGASGPLSNVRGQLAYIDEPTGGVDLGYDELGRTTFTRRNIDALSSESTSNFAASGLLLGRSFDDGFAITYGYDPAGRVIRAGDLWSVVGDQTPSGKPRHERTQNGVDTTYDYDVLDLTRQVTVKDATGTPIYDVLATRNAATEITAIADLDHVGLDHSATFAYDGFARLTDAAIGSGADAYTFGYRYDALHNMTSRTAIGPRSLGVFAGTYRYAESGRAPRQRTSIVDSTGAVTHRLGYDAAGRQTSQDQQTMTYDASDRLLRIDGVLGGSVTHAYGHDGARLKTAAPDGAMSYYFGDGSAVRNGVREHDVEVGSRVVARVALPAVTASRAASSGAMLAAAVSFAARTLGLALLAIALMFSSRWARRRVLAAATVGLTLAASCASPGGGSFRNQLSAAATATFLHTGFAAGPTVFTDSSGRVLEERRYEPFGVPIDAAIHTATGNLVGPPDVVARDLNELNKRTDTTTGWSDHGARWMAPETGRWLTTDPPVAAPDPKFMFEPWSLHPYQYVNQDPIRYWDPDGRYAAESEQVIENMLRVAAVGGGIAAEAAAIPGVGWIAAAGVAIGTAGIVGTIALSASDSAGAGGPYMGCDGPASCRTIMMAERHARAASKEQVAKAYQKGFDAQTKKDRDSSQAQFRVRLQAQGDGVEESVSFNQDTPVTVAQGLAGLEALKGKLSQKEFKLRERSFERAARFITNISSSGGAGPPGQSFPIHPRNPIRVDVEIFRGVNFKQ